MDSSALGIEQGCVSPRLSTDKLNVRARRWPGDTVFSSPFDNSTDIGVYCKAEIVALWRMVAKYFG